MSDALIALGSNLGNRQQSLDRAVRLLAQTPGVYGLHESAWRSTRAIGGATNQAEFLNGALLVQTSLAPLQLFGRLREIESLLGRIRQQRWGPRMIDLDLLLYDNVVLQTAALELPHPRMSFRRFVLEAAAEVAPNMLHPTIGLTVEELWKHLNDSAPYVAIRGSNSEFANRLAKRVAEKLAWKVIDLPVAMLAAVSKSSAGRSVQPAIEFPDEFLPLCQRDRWGSSVAGIITPYWIGELLSKLGTKEKGFAQRAELPRLLVCLDDQPQHRLAVPTLRLNTQDLAAAETELVAAIQAMS